MDFSFNEEQQSLGDTVKQALGDFPALTGAEPTRAQDCAVWNALSELGLFSLLVPEDEGGVGLNLVDCALAIEALGSRLASPLIGSTMVVTEMLARFGERARTSALMQKIANGDLGIAIASAEIGSADPIASQCVIANGKLSGRKITVPGALDAGMFLVLAQRDGKPVLVLVDASASGVTVRPHEAIDPSAGLGQVEFKSVTIEASDLVGANAGMSAVDTLVDLISTIGAGMAMGIAAHMQDLAVEYAKTRVQFGQPIGSFQSIKHRCADMAVAIEAGRATAYYAFWVCTTNTSERSRCASAAIAYCSEIARDACNDSIQIHGGMGFTWELGLHRYLRRAKTLMYSFGSVPWHYARVLKESLALGVETERSRRDAA